YYKTKAQQLRSQRPDILLFPKIKYNKYKRFVQLYHKDLKTFETVASGDSTGILRTCRKIFASLNANRAFRYNLLYLLILL
ncbi:MAG: hypothetical protein K2G37_03300, partial [Clostridia bacterium]|nr:hypothetical protein [Clostridia bacterium]